jgi:pyruvate formate lyase activating enzyme
VAAPVELGEIKKSINIIRASGIDYEFRTTVVPGIIGEEELVEIANELKSSKRFVIQQFRTGRTIKKFLQDAVPYPISKLERFCERINSFFKECKLRY